MYWYTFFPILAQTHVRGAPRAPETSVCLIVVDDRGIAPVLAVLRAAKGKALMGNTITSEDLGSVHLSRGDSRAVKQDNPRSVNMSMGPLSRPLTARIRGNTQRSEHCFFLLRASRPDSTSIGSFRVVHFRSFPPDCGLIGN
jgi:hypothetical protein